MPGGFTRHMGSSIPTNTVWFGAVPDRLNMFVPTNNTTNKATATVPANFGNLWVTANCSFGGFTTAPDGTTNVAQFITEDTSNSMHYIQGGIAQDVDCSQTCFGLLRFAGFFKASTRTRVGFQITSISTGVNGVATVVFDLAGGQVGVPVSITGSGVGGTGYMANGGTQIIAMPSNLGGGGWYLCIQDLFLQDFNSGINYANIFLDSGSGTGSLSQTYVGNGTSGLYVWRTNVMPVAAYAINNVTFFDDFNSISTIDTGNTKAPGFNWYMGGTWLNYNTSAFPGNQVSVSSSILTLTGPSSGGAVAIASAAQINAAAGTYVGRGFGANVPTLYELKANWDFTTHNPTAGETLTWWSSGLEWIVTQGQGVISNSNFCQSGREFDFMEASGTGGNSYSDTDTLTYVGSPIPGAVNQGIGGFSGLVPAAFGYPAWSATFNYVSGGGASKVISGGVVYSATGAGGNINQVPPNATYWSVVSPLTQPAAAVDYTQFHVYSDLIIPYWGQTGAAAGGMPQQMLWTIDNGIGFTTLVGGAGGSVEKACGTKLSFFDGALIGVGKAAWGPNVGTVRGGLQPGGNCTHLFNSDNQNLAIWLAPGGTTGQQFNVDYFKVTQ